MTKSTQSKSILSSTSSYSIDTDPNILQGQASNPDQSVWVSASAGSGKTKVLTERIIRLMLPTRDDISGCPAHKILALTFTKAGANEMALRIHKILGEWATMPEEKLHTALDTLLGYPPSTQQLEKARQLFAQVLDVPGGMKIMTIHSFCQSILGRFPLEAGISPHFKPLEDGDAAIFLNKARDHVIAQAYKEDRTTDIARAVHNISNILNQDDFTDTIKKVVGERKQLRDLINEHFDLNGLYEAICQAFNIPAGKTEEEILHDAVHDDILPINNLKKAVDILMTSSTNDVKAAQKIADWIILPLKQRIDNFSLYCDVFFKTDGDIRANFITKKIAEAHPDIDNIIQAEAIRIIDTVNKLKSVKTATATRDILLLGQAILTEFEHLKAEKYALDFDDMILKTLDLLKGKSAIIAKNNLAHNMTDWVRFKLDQGIDHILVDEAQDTNPEQWEIIEALCNDFFDGEARDNISGNQNMERTLFVVGDKKQSIFGFRRAAPKKFDDMKEFFKQKIRQSNKKFEDINFQTSFRSCHAVLSLVDAVFESPEMRADIDNNPIQHRAFHDQRAGMVELWPVFEQPEGEEYDPWTPPVEVIDTASSAAQMANFVAEQIDQWIGTKWIPSKNRVAQAGDIMILMRSRTKFIPRLVRALKAKKIPVSGVDRMIINEELVVEDLCACARVALLPSDDLTLACLLKSPFIGWDEQTLYHLAYNRQTTLWQALKKSNHHDVIAWLDQIYRLAKTTRPYDFFSHLLYTPCPANNVSGLKAILSRLGHDALDPLEEFLNNTLNFSSDHIPSLQEFIQYHDQQNTEIKREMDESTSTVRIMTVHGAKGLEAPIVILPDTLRSGQSQLDKILWPDRTQSDLPFFCPQTKHVPALCTTAINNLKQHENAESRRILYVALTRAEDELYIGGYMGKKKPLADSWYYYVARGFEKLPDLKPVEYKTGPHNDQTITAQRYIIHDKTIDHDNGSTFSLSPNDTDDMKKSLPNWLYQKVEDEANPLQPIMPSRAGTSQIAHNDEATPITDDLLSDSALSPLRASQDYRFLRGNITHKLLQLLPDLPQQKRESYARHYLAQPAHDLSQNLQDSIKNEVMAILNDTQFAPIFGTKSQAEVAINGYLPNTNQPVSGQIDRLYVDQDTVLIIDFKTNRPPPTNEEDIPPLYREQMRLYAQLIGQIYPDREIKAALIWTDGARLMEVRL